MCSILGFHLISGGSTHLGQKILIFSEFSEKIGQLIGVATPPGNPLFATACVQYVFHYYE